MSLPDELDELVEEAECSICCGWLDETGWLEEEEEEEEEPVLDADCWLSRDVESEAEDGFMMFRGTVRFR